MKGITKILRKALFPYNFSKALIFKKFCFLNDIDLIVLEILANTESTTVKF